VSVRRAGALLTAALLAPLAAAAAQNPLDRQIRENQARLDSIRRERGQLEDELTRLRGRERNLSTELVNLDRQRNATSRLVNELDRQISELGTQLDSITLELLVAEDALAEKRAVRERRIVELYKRGPIWAFQVMLAAESFGGLLSRYKYLHLISRRDQALVSEVAVLRDRIAEERRQVARVQDLVGRNRGERERELDRFDALERRRLQSLRQTQASAERAREQLSELERSERQINSLITNLERRRREAAAAGRATFPATISDEDIGTLEWPAAGEVLYRFGRAAGPRGTVVRRDGLGIRASVGTEVRAVASGEVVVAGPMLTYGPSVMLDHGGGFYTLYLYLSQVSVVANQRVEGGALVGRSGGQATEEGPHFEFQIRQVPRTGTQPLPLDPLNWLKPRN
jgi:septal ring factor EnvC (AmiA/AmiB activator)